jgi:hypothetical protein
MRRNLMKRLEALEKAVNKTTVPKLMMIDADRLPDADRDRFWAGDTAVLGLPDNPMPGTISTVVISVSPACQESWRATRGMSDAERNAYEERRIREEAHAEHLRAMERRTAPPPGMNEPSIRYDASGYPISDN